MVAILVIASDRGTRINARRLYQQYRTHYSSYSGLVAALNKLASAGYIEHVAPHRWELTVPGVHRALLVLAKRYRRNTSLLVA